MSCSTRVTHDRRSSLRHVPSITPSLPARIDTGSRHARSDTAFAEVARTRGAHENGPDRSSFLARKGASGRDLTLLLLLARQADGGRIFTRIVRVNVLEDRRRIYGIGQGCARGTCPPRAGSLGAVVRIRDVTRNPPNPGGLRLFGFKKTAVVEVPFRRLVALFQGKLPACRTVRRSRLGAGLGRRPVDRLSRVRE